MIVALAGLFSLPFIQKKKKRKIDFSRWRLYFSYILLLIILAIFYLKVALYFLPSFEPTGLSVQEKKRTIYFYYGGHLRFPIRTISATVVLILLVSPSALGFHCI